MKISLLILMLSSFVSFAQEFTNGVFTVVGGNASYTLAGKHLIMNDVHPTVSGRTYEVNNFAYDILTTNHDSVTLYFSNQLISKINTNSEIGVYSFNQEVTSISTEPSKATFGNHSLSVALLKGEAYFINSNTDTNSSTVVSTPFGDIELHKGSFYFVVNEHNILALVIDGSLTAYGDKKEEKTVKEGNALVAMPNNVGILDSKISLSTQFIHDPVMNRMKNTIKDISKAKDTIVFIRINGKTVGVNIN